ncbi:uncharacterized protein LOC110249518 [Exaiptasia diaphana]|uniref:G-protein coupled receptors family 1 profile domain-containing protein n=1 Tax=Exaiptasia diaphana TaxID=2652724 RepID=A0A913XXA5_EXADI|nr:uncharacterized protein LOC110249518 [Exaiptasia diaphana]XP_020911748.1 uncharacterized protein LOC110249518 [Exaiptasia diaphana]XP_028518133.1 uncharacterized protein LOC110249518 [Exaiptasia diaphana]
MEYTPCEEDAFAANWVELLYFELLASICSFVLAGVSGTLIYLVVIKNPHKKLRTSLSAVVITMATGSLLMGLIAEPLFMYFTIATLNDVIINPQAPFLLFAILLSFTSSMATLFSVVGITVNRYLFVTVPGWFKLNVSFNRTLIATSMGWIIAISYPFLYFNTGLRRYCILHSTAGVLFTTFPLIFTFAWIFNKLEALKNRGQVQLIVQEACVSYKHSWLLVASLGCYVPALVMTIIAELCSDCSCMSKAWLTRTSFLITRLHCAICPVAYAIYLNQYRSAMRNMVFKKMVHESVMSSIRRTEREINCFEMSKTSGIRTAKL